MRKYKKRTVLILCMSVFFVVGVAAYVFYPSEYQRNLKLLEKTCGDLTRNDLDGKVYEPVIGKYIKRKSLTSIEEGTNSPARYSSKVVLWYKDNEITLFSKTMTQEIYNDDYLPIIKKVFDEPDNQNRIYGICGYQEDDKYIGIISTLRKLGE